MANLKSKFLTERFSTDIVRGQDITYVFKSIAIPGNVQTKDLVILAPLGAEDAVVSIQRTVGGATSLTVTAGICDNNGGDYGIATSKSMIQSTAGAFADADAMVLPAKILRVSELSDDAGFKTALRTKTPYLCLQVATVTTSPVTSDIIVRVIKGSQS